MTTIYEAFGVRRRTENRYDWASRRGGKVAFHQTFVAAQRRGGEIRGTQVLKRIEPKAKPCPVCDEQTPGFYVTGPSAVTREMTTHRCHYCNREDRP